MTAVPSPNMTSSATSPKLPERSQPSSTPHAHPATAVLIDLGTDEQNGLHSHQVAALRAEQGWNELAAAPPEPLWRKFLGQFGDVVVWILIVAALVSGVLGEWTDATAIIAIVLLNAILGFMQEEKAERALAMLQTLAAPVARVLRDGRWQALKARELVSGDVVDLDAGDNVPADVRLLEAFSLRVQESALTGESVPVDKNAQAVLPASAPLGDRRNMAYMGTVVAAGKGRAVVVGTGMRTELGRIAGMLQTYEAEPTPLQRKLAQLGKVLVAVCLVLIAIIFAMELWQGDSLMSAFLLSVSLAVAAVPEGLPAVVTVSLALGLQRMVKRNALIRKLPSVETLGSVTVICSDKTGTLTRNEMTVREVLTGDGHYRVTGSGYAPRGDFQLLESQAGVDVTARPDLSLLLTIAARCNHAQVMPSAEKENTWQEGRAIYDNIQKFLTYLLSCNVGEMLLMLVASLLGWPPPLLPVQLLWINLVTDGLPALALGLEPPERGVMNRKPRSPQESMLSLGLGATVILQGVLLAAVGLTAFGIVFTRHPEDEVRARTMAFCVVVYGELFRALAARSRQWTFLQLGPFTNPYLFGAVAISGLLQVSVVLVPFARPVFETVLHPLWEWGVLILLALTPVTVIELTKLVRQRAAAQSTPFPLTMV